MEIVDPPQEQSPSHYETVSQVSTPDIHKAQLGESSEPRGSIHKTKALQDAAVDAARDNLVDKLTDDSNAAMEPQQPVKQKADHNNNMRPSTPIPISPKPNSSASHTPQGKESSAGSNVSPIDPQAKSTSSSHVDPAASSAHSVSWQDSPHQPYSRERNNSLVATDHESLMEFFDEAMSDNVSLSGYSAYSGKRDEAEPMNYYLRLVKFYQRYNPEKLSRVEEFLSAYRGEEEQLFQILAEKYGPEPEMTIEERCSVSDYGGPSASSGQNGPVIRYLVPKVVSAADGFTNGPTPYWPGSREVSDTDLLDLMIQGKTSNVQLQKSYCGIVKTHPLRAWNGMTYVTNQPVPADGQRFLGHLWSGSLANNKVLINKGKSFNRFVMHCADICQTGFPHERWRLTMYRTDEHDLVLYRSVWDPILNQQMQPTSVQSATTNQGTASAVIRDPKPQDDKPFFSFSWARKRSNTTAVSSNVQPEARRKAVSSPPQPIIHMQPQPQQPQEKSAVDVFLTHLQGLETRIMRRLDAMEGRIQKLEGHAFGSKTENGHSVNRKKEM